MDWYKNSQTIKLASKEILYHGTSTQNLRSILTQGLIVDPKKRVWSEDPDESYHVVSRKSFPGIYLTNNFMTAYSSAGTAQEKIIGKRGMGLIIAVQVETRTLVADEDNLTFNLEFQLNGLFEGYILNEWLTQQAYLDILDGKLDPNISKSANKFLDFILKEVDVEKAEHIKNNCLPLIKDLLIALLTRNMAWIKKNTKDSNYGHQKLYYEFLDAKHSIDEIPSTEEAGEKFRVLLEQATRKLTNVAKDITDYNFTARSIGDISFSGANKILAIMSYEYKKDSKDKLKFWYGKDTPAAEKLISDYKRHIGSDFIME